MAQRKGYMLCGAVYVLLLRNVSYRPTRRHIPEVGNLKSYRNLNAHITDVDDECRIVV
jgi:hypothetical protein